MTKGNPNGRPKYYSESMRRRDVHFPDKLWEKIKIKSEYQSIIQKKKITISELIRKACEKFYN